MSKIPNQFHIYIKKPKKYDSAFYTGNCENTNEAYRTLTKSGFGLYMWFLQNQSDYDFYLFSVKAQKDLGFSARTYDSAIKELKDKKYLVCQGMEGFHPVYYFYDTPNEL